MAYNRNSLTQLTGTIAQMMGVEKPETANKPIEGFYDLLGSADKILIYNPDAVGMWLYQKYFEKFLPVIKHAPVTVPLSAVMPSVTPVCFATMYTGVTPEVHGITAYTKPVVTIGSLFDVLIKSGKKPAIVAVKDSSMATIFAGKPMDYFIEEYDPEVIIRAKELINAGKHDFIAVYTQEYDDVMHQLGPENEKSLTALDGQIRYFDELANCAKAAWKNQQAIIGFCPDHGIHLEDSGHGTHGTDMEEDINILHFFGGI